MVSQRKLRAALLSIGTAFFLLTLKLTVAMFTLSVSVLSLALDSLGDLLSSSFSYFSLRYSEVPPDEDHHFGHGKFENFATLVQSAILFISAGYIFYQAIKRLFYPEDLYYIDLGIGVMIASGIISYFISQRLEKVAVETESLLLKTDALHFRMDVFTHFIVIVALLAGRWMDIVYFDIVACLGISSYIVFQAIKISKSSFDILMDKTLPEEENVKICQLLDRYYPKVLSYDQLRTRKSGTRKIINLRVTICRKAPLEEAHDIVDRLEKEIQQAIPFSEAMIHAEPCSPDCPGVAHCHLLKRN